jgi:hypothetical protein
MPEFVSMLAAAAVVIFLWKDRDYWRGQYQKLNEESRERERWFADQLLAVKGYRPVGDASKPTPARSIAPALSDEDAEILNDRIRERFEAGLIGAGEAEQLFADAKFGRVKMSEVDRILAARVRADAESNGSVADIE